MEDEKGVRIMCKAWEEERRKGKAEGKYNTNLKSLKNIMLKLNINLKEAMELLGISIEEYDCYGSVFMK